MFGRVRKTRAWARRRRAVVLATATGAGPPGGGSCPAGGALRMQRRNRLLPGLRRRQRLRSSLPQHGPLRRRLRRRLRLECHDVNDCSASCGDDCTIDCHNTVSCGAFCGANCHYDCHDVDRCGVRAGPGSVITCTNVTTCVVECWGACQVSLQRHQPLRADLPARRRLPDLVRRTARSLACGAAERAPGASAASRVVGRHRLALLSPAVARRAEAIVRYGRARSVTPSEIEPHLVFGSAPPGPGYGSGAGIGVRASFVVAPEGFIRGVNDSAAIGFGLDLGHYYGSLGFNGYRDQCLHFEPGPNGTSVCTDVTSNGGTYNYLFVPVPSCSGTSGSPIACRPSASRASTCTSSATTGSAWVRRLLRRRPPSRRRPHHAHRPYRLPDDRHRRLVHDVSSRPASSAGSGFEYRNPCPRRQPSARRASAWPRVSTPSATTSMPRLCASDTIAFDDRRLLGPRGPSGSRTIDRPSARRPGSCAGSASDE